MGRRLAASSAAIAVSALALSCGVSASFLSDSERSSLYTVVLNSSDGKAIADGASLEPGSAIVAGISKLSGASDPSALEITLAAADAGITAGLRVQTADFKPADKGKLTVGDSAAATVDRVAGTLPALAVPGSVRPDTYTIAARVLGADGAVLQSSRTVVFIGLPRPAIEALTSFPPAVEPGAPVLLSLSVSRVNPAGEGGSDAAGATMDPWIAWSFEGKVFAEGLLSSGLDETVWRAPGFAGAYSVSAQVYPAAPPGGRKFSFRSSAAQDLRVMAIASPGGSGDDFADSLSFLCLLRLDGDFSDSGTRPRGAQPAAFGSPRLDVYSSGFGYRLDASAGIRVPGLMPPASDDRLLPFSILVRLDPYQGDGALTRFESDDGTYSLVIGLKDWKPYVEFSFDGKILQSTGASAVPRAPMTLEAVFRPEGERLAIEWRAEGERIESPSVPLPPAPPVGGAAIGGPLSLPGVYDGLGLSSGPPSPAFRLASRRKWKASIILAEGFEDGRLPRLSVASGAASVVSGSLALGPGASLALDPGIDPAAGAVLEASMSGDRASARLDFAFPSGERAFSVTGEGEVLGPDGARLGVVEARSGRLSIGLSASEGACIVSSGQADPVAVPGQIAELSLSIRREGGIGALSIESVLARRATARR
jgi:hypothetical protein